MNKFSTNDLSYREWALWDSFRSKNSKKLGKLTAAEYSEDYDTELINNVQTIIYPIVCALTLEYEYGEESYQAFNVEDFNWNLFIYLVGWKQTNVHGPPIYDLVWNDHRFKLTSWSCIT